MPSENDPGRPWGHPEAVFGAGEALNRHLSPLTFENGYEFISLCLASFGLIMVEWLKWWLAQAYAGHPRKLHQVCESLLISSWERGGRHIIHSSANTPCSVCGV